MRTSPAWPGRPPERSGAPEAVSDPAVFASAATNTKHAVYRGPFRHLFELWWVHGGQPPTVVDLTLAARAPRAVDRPAAFTFDAANTRYVVYRGFDNQLYEISWTARPGASPGRQSNWRWCNRCQGLFYGGNTATSRCPAAAPTPRRTRAAAPTTSCPRAVRSSSPGPRPSRVPA
jgi:hypothetical protein